MAEQLQYSVVIWKKKKQARYWDTTLIRSSRSIY